MALFGSVHPYADPQTNRERHERRVVAELRRWLLDSQVLGLSGCFRSSNTQTPKAVIVEKIRSRNGAEKATEADKELPDKLDTDTDAELLKKYDIDPSELSDEFGGQAPMVG